MTNTTFIAPDLAGFLALDALGTTVPGMRVVDGGGALVECRIRVAEEDPFCRRCGAEGVAVGTVASRLVRVDRPGFCGGCVLTLRRVL